jgi:hypothetical protein
LAVAQTTGVPGINHYTIMGGGAICNGSPSCTTCCFFTPVTLACNVSTAPGNLVVILWSFCPCTAGFLCGPINACVPAIPNTACTSTTNQSFDLALGCVMTTFVGVANTTGNATVNISFPTLGPAAPCSIGPLGTQAVVLDPCGLGVTIFPGPFVATQAYDVSFW